MAKQNRRKYYLYPFVEPKLQFTIAILFVIVGVFNALYFSLLFFVDARESFFLTSKSLPESVLSNDLLNTQLHMWLKMTFYIVLPEAFFVLVFGLFFSHRITGPILATSIRLKEIANGNIPEPFKVRKYYFWAGLASQIEHVILKLKQDRADLQTALQKAEEGNLEQTKTILKKLLTQNKKESV